MVILELFLELGISAPLFSNAQTLNTLSSLVETHGRQRGTGTYAVIRGYGIDSAYVTYADVSEESRGDVLDELLILSRYSRGAHITREWYNRVSYIHILGLTSYIFGVSNFVELIPPRINGTLLCTKLTTT